MSRTPHISELSLDVMFPDRYLKAEHLVGKDGKPVAPVVELEHIAIELVPMSGGKKAAATVVTLRGKQKQWIVNKTNALSIAVLLGSKRPVEWIGKRVQLVVDQDEDRRVKGLVPCIRVLGSPDATPTQAEEYRRAWQGQRKGGALCSRLKAAVARLVVTEAPPVEEPVAEPVLEEQDAAGQDAWEDVPAVEEPVEAPRAAPLEELAQEEPGANG